MLCVSLMQPTFETMKQHALKHHFVEIRLDSIKNLTLDGVQELFQYCHLKEIQTIATLREEKGISESLRHSLLMAAINGGADYVDLEIEGEVVFQKRVIQLAKERGTTVIISYHNYSNTPPRSILIKIIKQAIDRGADLVKIATMVDHPLENSRLLGLLDQYPVIVVGMGVLGQITRVAAPLLGAPFTFAAQDQGAIAAPGQLKGSELKAIWKRFTHE